MTPKPEKAVKGEKMTAEERADDICEDLEGRMMGKRQIAIWFVRLTREIKAAEEAAREEGTLDQKRICAKHCEQQRQEGYAKGFSEARELAARVAEVAKIDRHYVTTGAITKVIAEAIRQLRPSEPLGGEEK